MRQRGCNLAARPHGACCVGVLIGLLAAPVFAETMEERGFRAVDPAIADMGPHARSLRHIETGIGTTGQFRTVYRRVLPDGDQSDKLYHVEPGLIAEFDRVGYVRTRNGQVLQAISENTLFYRGTMEPAESGSADHAGDSPHRLDGQWNGLVDGWAGGDGPTHAQIVGRIDAAPEDPAPEQFTAYQQVPLGYLAVRRLHRNWLLRQIGPDTLDVQNDAATEDDTEPEASATPSDPPAGVASHIPQD